MELRDRLLGTWRALPMAHRVGLGAAVAGLMMLAVVFFQWVSTPSYTVLASGLGDGDVAHIVDQLETDGVPYEIGNGGTTVLVPRNQLYTTRASLAQAGVASETRPAGYELLDEQGLTVSDFRQQVDYQRALEGELARTLMAMDGIRSATVHLVLPDEELFTERQRPTTASVLVDTVRPLNASEVEAVTFLVASSVEGLEAGGITVADASGAVLHAPGDTAVPGAMASRQLRETREFEGALASDITALLTRATGSPASVVVRASLNFDETSTEVERFDEDSQVALREQTTNENFEGTGGMAPEGAVGVDGGPIATGEGESTYEREEVLREYGVDRTMTVTSQAPGKVEKLSVAIVMDDGTATGVTVPDVGEVQALVAAAVGLEEERGDSVAVSTVPFPVAEEVEGDDAAMDAMLDRIPQLIALVVLVVIAVGLFLMTRRRGDEPALPALAPVEREGPVIEVDDRIEEPVAVAAAPVVPNDALKREVSELVDRQPEEIATLLRGWLADQRSR